MNLNLAGNCVNLLNNENFVTEHNITLCYSFSEKYKEGLKRKISSRRERIFLAIKNTRRT